jgi:hypothetical protein
MVRHEDNVKSMEHRISNILGGDRAGQRDFAPCAQAEDAEELEYLLARAEVSLRDAQARVEELQGKLAKSQDIALP